MIKLDPMPRQHARYALDQLMEDRVDFNVSCSAIEGDEHVAITIFPNCDNETDCDYCNTAKNRALNNMRYWTEEAPGRTAPHNSTDDYDDH